MSWEPIETSLDTIESGLSNLNEDSLPSVLRALDRFQQDPLVLIHRGVLTRYVSLICDNFFELSSHTKLLRCKVFYTISKVVSWKRSVRYLPIDVYILKKLVPLLENQREDNWYIQFFILCWIYVLCLSPFQLEIDEKLYHLVSHCKAPSTVPLVVNIRSQLLSKNKALFHKYRDELDLSTFNAILKLVIHQEDSVVDMQTLNRFTEHCLHGPVDIVKLKMLPKLFLRYALEMDANRTQDIITWVVSQFGHDFTDTRFAIAHCYAKIVKIVVGELEEEEMFGLLVENCLNPTAKMLRFEPWDVLDQNRLHTYLLVIAELSTTIVEHAPEDAVSRICQDIIPYASRFQQLRANTIKGSQIRDASNFICWSLARAKNGKDHVGKEDLNNVFLNVLMCSLFDRELLIRKSANAALQEILGRYVTFAGILDNKTILQIIELPINNLPKHITSNTLKLYEMLSHNDERFSTFMIHWLFDSCIMANHDLSMVQWTTWTLCQWAKDLPNGLRDTGILGRIENLKVSTPLEASRLLYLLVQMKSRGLSLAATRMHALSKLVLDSTVDRRFRRNDYELFQFLAIFEYAALMLQDDGCGFALDVEFIDLVFRMLRGFEPSIRFHQDMVRLLRVVLPIVSTASAKFVSTEAETRFWDHFEHLIRSNNSCCCYSFSTIESHRFVKTFRNNLPLMDCQGKSQTLDSFQTVHSLRNAVQVDKHILVLVTKLLDDYTITEQGDVGRLVRTSAAQLVSKNQDLFEEEQLRSQVISSLIRLSGEPNEEIRSIAINVLQKTAGLCVEDKIDLLRLMEFQSSQFNDYLKEFWKGFLMSAGAIHSTEIQIRTAIDAFLHYYNLLPNDSERLAVCNDLVRIIPSANLITESKSQQTLDPETRIVNQDILKITVSYINFWHRVLESGLRIDPNFNFQGFYAKLYNLHLLNGASLLRSTIVGFFAQLVVSLVHSRDLSDRKLINSIIERLLTIMKREASRRRKATQTSLEQDCLKALATIFLELKSFTKLDDLVKCSNSKEGLLESSISMFTM
ncbi:ZYRO0D04708p [Zygosaccharomyces rouxii]|uniref:ZYRO0D04708p n=1 Tax=Zygosaccharomyces rouxii (strain ATCC 2623 / CBS 732 / NBRC 1130 / NCYC 568 / NRRL Y-229) TaxID=559307 RepID=C5DV85_ZYGRC|nr:uncharacterized protein ZYRO0D04708g [Zygosaccharomyces rouxii]KAH9200618.1 hypothetical protein LQ764DRAFT_178199 [Zygosaccharomyces rouxii]CAR27704.1 ZYRO0D04708p [Zygosaccharomyces rouxii]